MIRIRIDDFPHTKGEPQHTLDAYRTFHRELTVCTGVRYLLGVIPGRCTPEDILFLRNETDCVIGMHGVHHDESKLDLYQNEFPPFFSEQQVGRALLEASDALEQAVGREVRIYMPPRNRIDWRTVNVLQDCGFFAYTGGPETDFNLASHAGCIMSLPPDGYGRTDELLRGGAHERLAKKCLWGNSGDWVLGLHWTWETNIGLHHMREFFSRIPRESFGNFDE